MNYLHGKMQFVCREITLQKQNTYVNVLHLLDAILPRRVSTNVELITPSCCSTLENYLEKQI